jgi:hypothetical protein
VTLLPDLLKVAGRGDDTGPWLRQGFGHVIKDEDTSGARHGDEVSFARSRGKMT